MCKSSTSARGWFLVSLFLQSVKVTLNANMTLWHASHSSQFGVHSIPSSRSLMWMLNRLAPSIHSWGTALVISLQLDVPIDHKPLGPAMQPIFNPPQHLRIIKSSVGIMSKALLVSRQTISSILPSSTKPAIFLQKANKLVKHDSPLLNSCLFLLITFSSFRLLLFTYSAIVLIYMCLLVIY